MATEAPIKFLDFNCWRKGYVSARAAFAKQVRAEFMETGFFRLTNHGIPQSLITHNRELMTQFFTGLTTEQRMRYSFPDTDGQLGYTPLDMETAVGADHPDHKHFLMHGDCNELPEILEVPGLRDASVELFDEYRALYIDFMEVVGRALDLDLLYFGQVQKLGNSSLRQIHYPKHDNPATGDDDTEMSVERGGNIIGMCNEPHTDICALTLLFSSQPGLQLWHNNRWQAIPCSEESLVVNCGDMLQHLTGGRFKSGIHRVVCPPGRDRYSMPFFGHFEPAASIVPLSCLGDSDLKKYRFKTAIEYLLYRLEQIKLRKMAKTRDSAALPTKN